MNQVRFLEIAYKDILKRLSVRVNVPRIEEQVSSTLLSYNQGIIYIESPAQAPSSAKAAPAADPLDISQQLGGMRSRQDGWAEGMQAASQRGEGYGKAPSAEGLDWLAKRFAARYAANLPRPYLYPTPDGGVQAEWTLGAYEVSLEIDLAVHSAEWHCLNHYTTQSDERRLDLNEDAAWKWLDNELRRLGSDTESLKGANEAVMRGERPARRFTSQADLRKFFEYTSWAAGPGPEPDWSESLRILQESQLKGLIEP